MTTFVLGGGCFWCLDAVYRRIKGVKKVECGYAGGVGEPTYFQVATGTTGHAEVVRVSFDETIIPPQTILEIYFLIHNPTTLNRQGADKGPQYRSVMFFEDDTQKELFEAAKKHAQVHWSDPIVTDVTKLPTFYLAEEEHQDYFNKNPEKGYCQIIIEPKIVEIKENYTKWFKEDA